MNPKFRRIAVFVGAAALAGGAGIGVAARGDTGQAASTPGMNVRPRVGRAAARVELELALALRRTSAHSPKRWACPRAACEPRSRRPGRAVTRAPQRVGRRIPPTWPRRLRASWASRRTRSCRPSKM